MFPILYPVGALVATIILGAVFTLFALALRALDRAVTRVADGVLSGLVSGFDYWSAARRPGMRQGSPGAADREEPSAAVPVELVRRT
jgi:uncharacterized membrane protein